MLQQQSAGGSITIDASGLIRQLSAFSDPVLLRQLLELVVYAGRQVWTRAVSGTVYTPMVHEVRDQGYAAAIWDPANEIHDGELALMIDVGSYAGAARIEDGVSPFDMKPGLLRAAAARGKEYLDVPFRHGTPAGKKDGPSPRANIGNSMPSNVYAMAKRLTADTGDALVTDPTGVQWTKPPVGGMQSPYAHKAGKFQGLQKRASGDGGNRYLTWRRVGKHSDPDSWWHPGQPANPLVEAVVGEIERLAPQIMQAYLDEILGN